MLRKKEKLALLKYRRKKKHFKVVVVEDARIFSAPLLKKILEEAVDKKNFQKVEMAWDDAALNITVNPLEVTHLVKMIRFFYSLS